MGPSTTQPLTVGENEVQEDAEAELGVLLHQVVGEGSEQRHAAPVLVGQSQRYFPDVIGVELFSKFQSLPGNILSGDVKGKAQSETPGLFGAGCAAATG